MNKIPSEKDWGEYWKDFDQKSAYDSYFGKSNEQMQPQFYSQANELMSEIRFMPPIPFKYYILGFRDFISHGEFAEHDASDIASYFLDMVEHILKNDPELIASSMKELIPTIEHIAQNQSKYEAIEEIYGNFPKKLEGIVRLCHNHGIII